jgi:hypothetical protein
MEQYQTTREENREREEDTLCTPRHHCSTCWRFLCAACVGRLRLHTPTHTHTHSKGAGWSVHITLAPGNYEFKFLLDDTAWAHDQTKVCCICMYTYIYYNVSLI